VPENNAQTHKCMDLNKVELITNVTGFARFNEKTRELTAD
jgi:hypothetical protein